MGSPAPTGRPVRYGRPFWPALALCVIGVHGYCAEQPGPSHVERFASPAERLRFAEQRAEAEVKANPSDAHALLGLGLARLRLGKLDAAIADFRRAAAEAPGRAEAQTDLAYALWKHGELEDALRAARAALVLDPSDAAAHRYAGRLLLLQGRDREDAIAHLEKAAQLDPEETDVHFDLLMAYRATGDRASAWAQLRLLQTEFPDQDPRLLYVQGLLVSDQGRSAPAIDLFRRAWKGNPRLEEARDELGVELAKSQRWAEALEVLAPASQANPQSFRVAYAYALALMTAGRLEEAAEQARRAVILNPGAGEARRLLDLIQARRAVPLRGKP